MDVSVLWWGLAVMLVTGGMLGTLLPVVPSTPLILLGMLLAGWLDGFRHVGWPTFVILALLVLVSQILDVVAGALGAKKVGASALAIWGGILGSVLGILGGLPGLLLGPLLGAAAGEYLARQNAMQAGKVGLATLFGLLLGAMAKVAIALSMLGVFIFAWLI